MRASGWRRSVELSDSVRCLHPAARTTDVFALLRLWRCGCGSRSDAVRACIWTWLLLLCLTVPAPAWSRPSPAVTPELDGEALKDLARAPPERPSGPAAGSADVGRPYRLVLPFDVAALSSLSPAIASYNPAAQTLTLTFRPVGAAEGAGVELDHVTRIGRRLSVNDGTAPVTSVQAYRSRKLDADFVGGLPAGAGAGAGAVAVYTVSVEHVSADEAVALERSTEVVLTGRIADFDKAGPSRCSLQTLRTTGQQPSLTNLVTCAVALSLDEVAIVTHGGHAMRSWLSLQMAATAAAPAILADEATATGSPPALSQGARVEPAKPVRAAPQAPEQSDAPAWSALPSSKMIDRVYPLDAFAAGRGGDVTLNCLELVDGRVADCRIMDETPSGAGFGRAALTLSRSFRFTPFLKGGSAVQARIRIPYGFSVVNDGADAAPAPR